MSNTVYIWAGTSSSDWHAPERVVAGDRTWRWTDGDAALPPAAASALLVEIGDWARLWRARTGSYRARA